MSAHANCPCGAYAHPAVISNPPGLSVIRYRLGDFHAFRQALLRSNPGETALRHWRPGAHGDLAVQLVEWWAVLADILDFYNERAITQAFLRTADLPEGIRDLVRLLGYRPRPGIGAHGDLAALVSGTRPVTIRKGFAIQSKPGPGKEPQIFETDEDVTLLPGGVIDVDPPANRKLLQVEAQNIPSVLLAGTVTSVRKGDRVLLRKRVWKGNPLESAVVTVREVRKETTPRGATNTRVVFTAAFGFTDENAADWLLLRAGETTRLFATANRPIETVEKPWSDAPLPQPGDWVDSYEVNRDILNVDLTAQFTAGWSFLRFAPQTYIAENILHLDGSAAVAPDDALMIEQLGEAPRVGRVLNVTRAIWYANADPDTPAQPPADPQTQPPADSQTQPPKVIPIPVLHSVVDISAVLKSPKDVEKWNAARGAVTVTFGWTEVGTLIGTPAPSFTLDTVTARLGAPSTAAAPPAGALLEDTNGNGSGAFITALRNGVASLDALSESAVPLVAPLRLLTNLVRVSRGQSVRGEVLGSGQAAVGGQTFVLKQSPLTYLQSGETYASTLRVHVDDIEWKEVPSFYGQAAEARVFVTHEDTEQKTHVVFGDGINGARLPSGVDNVIASYRYGSGEEVPGAGTLDVVLEPQPGLRGLRNPVAVSGGSEPDAPARLRRDVPRSVMTFGRAISAADYEAIAAQAPGVRRARVTWMFDAGQQRGVAMVHVGDTAGAVASARTALLAAQDPNRRFVVELAEPVPVSLSLALVIRADHAPEPVVAKVRAALADDDTGLLGINVIRIGQGIFESEIHRVCVAVPGVLAVHALTFSDGRGKRLRHDPGAGGFFQLEQLDITTEARA